MSKPGGRINLIALLQALLKRHTKFEEINDQRWAEAADRRMAITPEQVRSRAEELAPIHFAARWQKAKTPKARADLIDRCLQDARIELQNECVATNEPDGRDDPKVPNELGAFPQSAWDFVADSVIANLSVRGIDKVNLREFLTCVNLGGGIGESTSLSANLARLNREGLADDLMQKLACVYPAVAERLSHAPDLSSGTTRKDKGGRPPKFPGLVEIYLKIKTKGGTRQEACDEWQKRNKGANEFPHPDQLTDAVRNFKESPRSKSVIDLT